LNGYLVHVVADGSIDPVGVLLNAVVVIGLVAWARKLLEKVKVAPADWVFVVSSAVLCFAVAIVMINLSLWFRMGLLTLAVVQLAYANVVKLLQRLVDKLADKE
jgi:hypothetical protein